MSDQSIRQEYHRWLRLERGYSPNTIEGYEMDLDKLMAYAEEHQLDAVKMSFEAAEVDPNFRIMEQTEEEMLSEDALTQALGEIKNSRSSFRNAVSSMAKNQPADSNIDVAMDE